VVLIWFMVAVMMIDDCEVMFVMGWEDDGLWGR
jgi:hypothetical protein